MPGAREDVGGVGWPVALGGLFVFVVAVVSLSGPGRIDIIDGQPRYEVARSLVEHGDAVIRNPEVTFLVLPGRGGLRYSFYRFPQSVLGAGAILLADATGPVGEARRQFFFTLTGAVACGVLALAYAFWFRRLGVRPGPALGWALAGIFCTPNWFYGTSSFDDILGTTAVVGALVLAWYGQGSRPRLFAALSGLALGLAINCKQPLGLFLLPVLALTIEPGWLTRRAGGVNPLLDNRTGGSRPLLASTFRASLVLAGVGVGLLAYAGYEWYKFPPGTTAEHPKILDQYVPAFPGTPRAALLCLLFSPGAGVPWYCPTIFLSAGGLVLWWRRRPLFTGATAAACAGFVAFICCLIFFKGDLSWGPRYLTPVLAVLWLLVPAVAASWPRRLVGVLLGLGLCVQLLGLSVDFHRLYVELRFPSGFYQGHPLIYFHPRAAHILNRPREIYELLTEDRRSTVAFSPCALPTEAPPCPEFMERGAEAVRKYRFLNSFRPWWASFQWLPPAERPVALGPTAALLLILAASGMGLMAAGLLVRRKRTTAAFARGRGVTYVWEAADAPGCIVDSPGR